MSAAAFLFELRRFSFYFNALLLAVFLFSTPRANSEALEKTQHANQLSNEKSNTQVSNPEDSKKRPKIALVLSGGGARGFAHIGVLRVLKQLHIPVDMVVGTSMGAVIGGAYAAGRSVEELEKIIENTAWDSVLADRPARDELDFLRREEDFNFPSRIEFAILKSGITLPPSAAGNSALEHALTKLLPSGTRNDPINQLPLPFRSVASDLVTGELIELSDTPLFQTLRASLAVPGVFSPVHIKNKLVVDGGLVRNLPIDMAHKMGADIVIAVNVGTPLAQESQLGSAISVAQQMLQILTEQNVQRSLKELRTQDILISPGLDGISFLDFEMYHQAILAGQTAAQSLASRLSKLSVLPEHYAQLENQRAFNTSAKDIALPLARIEVKGTRYINPEALIIQTGLAPGQSVTEEQVREAATKLYGRGDLDHIETEIHDTIDQRSIMISANEASWSRNRLRLGLELNSDFRGNHSFSIGAMHIASSLNPWGGEVRSTAKLGSSSHFDTQLFQPLGVGSPWYLRPNLVFEAYTQNLNLKNEAQISFKQKNSVVGIGFGRHLSNWGDIQIGLSRTIAESQFDELLQKSISEKQRTFDTTQYFQFKVDTLDSLAFPSRGSYINGIWSRSYAHETAQKSLATSSVTALKAFHHGEWAGHLYGEWSKTQGGIGVAPLGGFLRLSGTPQSSLYNDTLALGRIVMARRIGSMPTTLGGAIRAGFSAEIGGGWGKNEAVKFNNFKQSTSGFISLDTRFGPFYLGAGNTKGTGTALYLFLGPIW